MRRTPLFFAFAGVELVRYLLLALTAQPFAAALPLAHQMLRLVAAPNLLFAVGFLFMGLDARRYADYRPLLAVGKAVALFSSLLSLPRLFGGDSPGNGLARFVIPGIALWDAIATAMLLLRRSATPPAVEPAQTEPERIEVD